jgi:predicted metal-dependent phosphoesterase TrpH
MNSSRLRITHLPTPIETLPRFSDAVGGPRLSMKRDDQTGLAFGGSKTRKLEFLLAEARDQGAKPLITGGVAAGAGRADLHVHTLWSDGAQAPEAIVQAAAGQLDVVAITDHDEVQGAVIAREFARAHPELGVEVVVGEEISSRSGHLIGLFLEERVPPGLSAGRTIELIHAQGGLAVAAHPFHPVRGRARGQRGLPQMLPDLPLDAVEVVNNAGVFSCLYDAWAAMRNLEWMLPVTAGSDAHHVWYIGSAVTRFPGRDAAALRTALMAGDTQAQVARALSADKLPRHLRLQFQSLLRFLTLAYRRRRMRPLVEVISSVRSTS